MTKRLIVPLGLLCALTVQGSYEYSGKSFFSTINPFQLNSPERLSFFHHDRRDVRTDGWGGALQLVGFWEQSKKGKDLAKYFFPGGKSSLVAGEWYSDAALHHSNDLLAHYFGVFTAPIDPSATEGTVPTTLTFQSSICMKPKHKVYGLGLSWQQDLCKCVWFDASTSYVQVRNKLNFTENITNAGAGNAQEGAFSTMSDALSSTRLDYGRFTNCTMKKNGFADVEVRLGYDKELCEGCVDGGAYIGGIIPTGTRVRKVCASDCDDTKRRSIFFPIVGNNHHWGLMFGTYWSVDLLRDHCDNPVTVYTDFVAKYLLGNTQARSFDVKGKPWSRYIPVWTNGEVVTETVDDFVLSDMKPLINYSTLCAKVKPGWTVDWNTALHYQRNCFGIELGANLFVREGEDVCVKESLASGLGFASLYDWAHDTAIKTASLESISSDNFGMEGDFTQVAGSNAYVQIDTSDLDPMSAAAPGVFNATFYLGFSGEWTTCKIPCFISVDGSYTLAADNGAMDNWMLWAKLGISF